MQIATRTPKYVFHKIKSMKKLNQWMTAAILFCGFQLFAACTASQDNPAEPVKPEVNQDRQAFEAEFSNSLQSVAEKMRFDAAKQAMTALEVFFDKLNDEALKEQITNMMPAIINASSPVSVDALNEADLKMVNTCLNERFGMTADELKTTGGFFLCDAYNTLGTHKVTFKDGVATQDTSDGFVLEVIDGEGKSSSVTLKFKDERDGVRFFALRLFHAVPVCIQLPQQVDIIVKTANGTVMNGSVMLTIANADSRYISFKSSDWTATATLNFEYQGRQESIVTSVNHTADHTFNAELGILSDGAEKFSLAINGMNKPYSEEYINSDELKSLRDCGTFFAASYEVLKTLKSSNVDQIEATLNNKLVLNASVSDVAGSLLALGNIRKLHGTQPGFAAIDQYTQQLNDKISFTMGIKDTNVTGQGALLTILKGNEETEYQPGIAFQFAGEQAPLALLDRMTETDKANYSQLMTNFEELSRSFTKSLQAIQKKVNNIKF